MVSLFTSTAPRPHYKAQTSNQALSSVYRDVQYGVIYEIRKGGRSRPHQLRSKVPQDQCHRVEACAGTVMSMYALLKELGIVENYIGKQARTVIVLR